MSSGNSRTTQLMNRVKLTLEQATDLEDEYENKIKGPAYNKRVLALRERFKYLINKVNQLGLGKVTTYMIIVRKEKNVVMRQRYQITLSQDFSPEDVENIVKLRLNTNKILSIEPIQQIELGKIYEV